MSDQSTEMLEAINEIRNLLRLIAEPQVAARDEKFRTELAKIVGKSAPQAKAVFLMDGTRTQIDIRKEIGIHQGQLSTLVKQLLKVGLVTDEDKKPKLVIPIPSTFFEKQRTS